MRVYWLELHIPEGCMVSINIQCFSGIGKHSYNTTTEQVISLSRPTLFQNCMYNMFTVELNVQFHYYFVDAYRYILSIGLCCLHHRSRHFQCFFYTEMSMSKFAPRNRAIRNRMQMRDFPSERYY